VKNRIERKKSRRWGFLLFLLIFVTLFTGGYWLFNSRLHSFTEKQVVSSINFKKPGEKSLRINTIQPNSVPGKDSNSVKDNLNKGITKDGQGLVQRKIDKKHNNGNMRVAINSSEAEKVNLPENSDAIKSKQPVPETNDNVKSDVLANVQNDHIENFEIPAYNINKDSLIIDKGLVKQIDKQKDASADDSENKKSFNSPSKSKWHFGFLISGGISHVGNQFLGLGYSPLDYSQSASSNGGPGSGGGIQIPGPSKVKNSGAYTGGIFIEKDISKTKLSFGINYKVYNTSNNVGQKNDSTAFIDARNAVNRYHNHFNFIEFPLALKIQLGKSTTLPVFWEVGIIISQLLSSNALQFNSNSRVYFKDNSLLNKTQTGFSTGISTPLFSIQKNPILFGPYLYYGASHVANEGLYNKKHFVFIGLRTEILFGKNNF